MRLASRWAETVFKLHGHVSLMMIWHMKRWLRGESARFLSLLPRYTFVVIDPHRLRRILPSPARTPSLKCRFYPALLQRCLTRYCKCPRHAEQDDFVADRLSSHNLWLRSKVPCLYLGPASLAADRPPCLLLLTLTPNHDTGTHGGVRGDRPRPCPRQAR